MKRSPIKGRQQPMRQGKPLRRTRLVVRRRKDQVTASMRLAVLVRDGYRCVACGTGLDLNHWECHHRLLRGRGGRHLMTNLIALHPACHRWAHDQDLEATRRGLIVPSWADPSQVPVLRHGVRYMQPDEAWYAAEPVEWQVAAA